MLDKNYKEMIADINRIRNEFYRRNPTIYWSRSILNRINQIWEYIWYSITPIRTFLFEKVVGYGILVSSYEKRLKSLNLLQYHNLFFYIDREIEEYKKYLVLLTHKTATTIVTNEYELDTDKEPIEDSDGIPMYRTYEKDTSSRFIKDQVKFMDDEAFKRRDLLESHVLNSHSINYQRIDVMYPDYK